MIKKIYDRDTGNVYDVGADDKLKLVAEGTLEKNEELGDYKPINNINELKENVQYLIKLENTDGDLMTCVGEFKKKFMTSQFVYDYGYDKVYSVFIHKDFTRLVTYDMNSYEYAEGYTYKIFELPFSL